MHIRPRTAAYTNSRATLRPEIDEPTALNTGVLPGVSRSNYAGDIALTAGQTIKNLNVTGIVSSAVANASIENCLIIGGASQTGSALVSAISASNSNLTLTDCTIAPQNPYWGWMGITGAGFTALRCDIGFAQDIIEVKRTGAAYPWTTGVKVQQSYLHDMAWWTSATAGTIHPSDTETHNDVIQHFGGAGTQLIGNAMHGRYARQFGHWFVVGNSLVEPYVTVTLHSLGDALNGPNQAIPNRGTGTEATGRYNYDDIACLQIGDELGTSTDMTVHGNWFYGGGYSINGGGNANRVGASLGSWKRNRFDHAQGTQGSGGDNVYAMALGPWSGQVTVPLTGPDANVFMDNGNPIVVRY